MIECLPQQQRDLKRDAIAHEAVPSLHTRRKRIEAVDVDYEVHLKLIDMVAKSMSQIYDKHERFEALRHLSRLRRGLPLHLGANELIRFNAALHSLLSEHKSSSGDAGDDDNADVFLPSTQKTCMSVSKIAAKARDSARSSLI